jgi:hypothetical protein
MSWCLDDDVPLIIPSRMFVATCSRVFCCPWAHIPTNNKPRLGEGAKLVDEGFSQCACRGGGGFLLVFEALCPFSFRWVAMDGRTLTRIIAMLVALSRRVALVGVAFGATNEFSPSPIVTA